MHGIFDTPVCPDSSSSISISVQEIKSFLRDWQNTHSLYRTVTRGGAILMGFCSFVLHRPPEFLTLELNGASVETRLEMKGPVPRSRPLGRIVGINGLLPWANQIDRLLHHYVQEVMGLMFLVVKLSFTTHYYQVATVGPPSKAFNP